MTRMWPSRQEWAAQAEHYVRTLCTPMERVPEGAEHYLTEAECAEMDELYVTLSASARAPLKCAEPECNHHAHYAYRTQKEYAEIHQWQAKHPFKCTRHDNPDRVLRPDNPERTHVLVASKVSSLPDRRGECIVLPGLFWLPEGAERGGSGLAHGPGFRAHADDVPEGTRLTVTARIDLPVEVVFAEQDSGAWPTRPDHPHADELYAAAELLSTDAPVYAPGTARIIRGETGGQDMIVICDQHDDPDNPPATLDHEGCCQDCVFVAARDAAVARQLAALINAREPLAAWLEGMAESYSGLRSGSQRKPPAGSNLAHALATARAINRGIRG